MKKSEKVNDALKNIENRLRATINSIAGNHWCKNKEGVYIEANLSLASLLGIKPEDLIGKTDYDMPWKDAASELIRF
jgi:PAS domain-containing protein